ncbi:MAG TPA: tRNA-dihydrouridine synthase [Myxococcota bacterium]|nr:tRNA-dihydrouridine synthase [Myxococcota bacterium]
MTTGVFDLVPPPSPRPGTRAWLDALFARRPAILAPMEDVSDAPFRRVCRALGADLCVTEFVNAEGLLRGARVALRKIRLAPGDQPTAIQIYGADPDRLVDAARVAEAAAPVFIDVNCGCWVPKIAARGAGAGWLRDPAAMVDMARRLVAAVALPVTVKTRVGWGPESHMPIVDLAQRLEDAGVAALTIHCRTAQMGHRGAADWSWAARARARVRIPVAVNGDVRSADDAERALRETGCAAVMIGRRAIDHPWVFREVRALLDRGVRLAPPTLRERLDLCRAHLRANVDERGLPRGVFVSRRHFAGYLSGFRGAAAIRRALMAHNTLDGCLRVLDEVEAQLGTAASDPGDEPVDAAAGTAAA